MLVPKSDVHYHVEVGFVYKPLTYFGYCIATLFEKKYGEVA